MTFLPVVQRELQVAARNANIRWQRVTSVALGLFLLSLAMVSSRQPFQSIGVGLFQKLTALLWLFAWLSGPLHTVDALTREKRDGTLGLLFLTDLSGYDIVLGKLVATALHQVMLLVGVLPVLALPILMGGITGSELGRVVLSLLLTQALSLATGLFFSTLLPSFWRALRGTLILLGTLTFLPVCIDLAAKMAGRPGPNWLVGTGPLSVLLASLTEMRRANPVYIAQWPIGASVLAGLTLLALGTASVLLRRHWQDVPDATDAAVSTRHPLAGWRHIEKRDWLEENPYYWLERAFRPDRRPLCGWAVSLMALSLTCAIAAVTFHWLKMASKEQLLLLILASAFLASLLVKLGFLLSASRRLGEDLRTGGLELLLTTPLTPENIVEGVRRALWDEFRPVLIGLTALILLLLPAFIISALPPLHDQFPLVVTFVATILMLWLDFRWGTVIALRAALRSTGPLPAFRQSILRVLLPGWCALGTLILILPAGLGAFSAAFSYGVFYFLAMSIVYVSAKRARLDLEHGLRDIAAGVGFDTDQRELAEDYRRAAMTWEDRWFNRR